MTDFIVVLSTVPDQNTAEQLAKKILASQLAACITLLPQATSYYYWQGELQRSSEVQLIIKSHQRCKAALMAFIKQSHPYQTPEIVVLSIDDGDKDYLLWLNSSNNA